MRYPKSLGTVAKAINNVFGWTSGKKLKCTSSAIVNTLAKLMEAASQAKYGEWNNFVATDEAIVYLGGSYGQRRVCNIRKCENADDKIKFCKPGLFCT